MKNLKEQLVLSGFPKVNSNNLADDSKFTCENYKIELIGHQVNLWDLRLMPEKLVETFHASNLYEIIIKIVNLKIKS